MNTAVLERIAPFGEGDLESVVDRIRSWANQISIRLGCAEVYLVGSVLHRRYPRDLDVSIIMDDDNFQIRYGLSNDELFDWNVYNHVWTPKMLVWGREVAKLTTGLQDMFPGLPVDLKIMHRSKAEQLYGIFTRIRLDQFDYPKEERKND